jgi:hypothetical protein
LRFFERNGFEGDPLLERAEFNANRCAVVLLPMSTSAVCAYLTFIICFKLRFNKSKALSGENPSAMPPWNRPRRAHVVCRTILSQLLAMNREGFLIRAMFQSSPTDQSATLPRGLRDRVIEHPPRLDHVPPPQLLAKVADFQKQMQIMPSPWNSIEFVHTKSPFSANSSTNPSQ